jgi:HEPN domain-containing protein
METNNNFLVGMNLDSGHLNQMISVIEKIVQPDNIYLLGSALNRKRSNSIFCLSECETALGTDYFILVLLSDLRQKSIVQWQDQIEQICNPTQPITCIVLESNTFSEWLKTGRRFAHIIVQSSTVIYNPKNITLCPTNEYDLSTENPTIERQYRVGISKAQEFLAGADLYRIRKQYSLALFMLHQATEQVLGTIVKIGMGYYCCSHNIERLLRYASWVNGQVQEIFPRHTESEKRLFMLLQKAYIESRYKEDYIVQYQDLLTLTERVRWLLTIFEDWYKKSVPIVPSEAICH